MARLLPAFCGDDVPKLAGFVGKGEKIVMQRQCIALPIAPEAFSPYRGFKDATSDNCKAACETFERGFSFR